TSENRVVLPGKRGRVRQQQLRSRLGKRAAGAHGQDRLRQRQRHHPHPARQHSTYVCDAEGKVFDVIPGIYTPDVYVKRLNEMRLMAGYVKVLSKERGAEFVRKYHEAQAGEAEAPKVPARLDVRKTVFIERPVVALVEAAKAKQPPANQEVSRPVQAPT